MTDAAVLDLPAVDTHLDWVPGCEWGGLREAGRTVSEPGCDREADWAGTATCCNRVRFYCDPHRTERITFTNTSRNVVHKPCGAPGAPMTWTPLKGDQR